MTRDPDILQPEKINPALEFKKHTQGLIKSFIHKFFRPQNTLQSALGCIFVKWLRTIETWQLIGSIIVIEFP